MSQVSKLAKPLEDHWPLDAPIGSALDEVLLASHLLGSDRAIANFGGGNTSVKASAEDHRGDTVRIMWVKASGSDLATMRASDFAALRLDDMVELFERDEMTDEEMVDYIVRCQLDPSSPRPSIETLLHAFIPAPHVHHTHPDAINVLAASSSGERLVEECFGNRAAWVPYIRPGFDLAKQVGVVVRNTSIEVVILAKHGLVVWGNTGEEAYRQTIAVINEAAAFAVTRSSKPSVHASPRKAAPEAVLRDLLPTLRGALSTARAKVLVVDRSERALEFVSSPAAAGLASVGAACPDHLVHTKRVPLWIPFDPDRDDLQTLAERVHTSAVAYRNDYAEYVSTYGHGETRLIDSDARVVLIERLGIVTAGINIRAARLARDLYERAVEVITGAAALDEFVSLTPSESFAIEYWPLELYKLGLAPPLGELEGKVAFVTGAAGAIGRAITCSLAEAGAAVVAFDLDGAGAAESVAEYGDAGLAVGGDVTSESAVAAAFAAAVDCFGGVDIVVSNAGIASSAAIETTTLADWNRNQSILGTGYFLVAREAFRVFRRQQIGGSIVFVASKNALVAGKCAAAYSAAKATELHLARCLAEEGGSAGIRVNSVNPDAVLQGSRIWDSRWREERAAAYGIPADQLEEHYRKRTTLGVNILPEDVAQAVLHFASERRSAKSTGNILNVDGGVPAAYTR